MTDCTDVCEIVIERLKNLGFTIVDEEDHTDVIDALGHVKFVKKERCNNAKL